MLCGEIEQHIDVCSATALANLVNIITFFIGGSLVPGSLATFATCMSVTMISRLMLNLHKRTEYGIFSELHLSEVENLNDLEFVAHRDGEGQSTSPSRNLHEFEDVPILPVNSPGPSGHAQ
ncbi:hypothetical protein B0H11DRAFT_1162530 [Mycena galericulata]|nr:hypothetical protein B0H11DRAFT_1162530 [Mycena galericulata]